jgi:hypothetical protein
MAWIESHTVLIRHRKLIECARELRLKPVYLLGHLHVLWHIALEQAEDGDLSHWSDEFIAESACYPGDAPQFVSLLQNHKWLDGKVIHDWLDYAGKYLVKKYSTTNKLRLIEIWAKHKREYGATQKRPESDPEATIDKIKIRKAKALIKDLKNKSLIKAGKPAFLKEKIPESDLKETIPQEAKERISKLCLLLQGNCFNPFQFIQKNIAAEIPYQVTEDVLGELVKHKENIKNPWAYALTILKKKYTDFNYAENLKKHMEYKSEGFVKDVLKNLRKQHNGDYGIFDG